MRLTKQIREQVIKSIVEPIVKEPIKKITAELDAIGQQAADAKYDQKTRSWIDAAPEGGLKIVGRVKLMDWEGQGLCHEKLIGSGWYAYEASLKNPIKVLHKDSHDYSVRLTKAQTKKVHALFRQATEIYKKQQQAKELLTSALYSCNTTTQLQNTYPELIPFLPESELQTKALAVTRDQLKKILPVKKEKQHAERSTKEPAA